MKYMNWTKLISNDRLNAISYDKNNELDARSEFQRDTDRIIFSSAFRRLQDKTQVFPFPFYDFIHNRLTHSLEVASVGRTLGQLAGNWLINKKKEIDSSQCTQDDIGIIVLNACLAHDIGNPPFGHAGEKAMRTYFKSTKGQKHLYSYSDLEKDDFNLYEGNAAGFRILTNDHPSGRVGGLRLTYSTLGTFCKYTRPSCSVKLNELGKKVSIRKSQSKVGYFQTEKNIFIDVAEKLGLLKLSKINEPSSYCRHPLAFLMEAADSTCYNIIDIEDGYRLNFIDYKTTEELLYNVVKNNPDERCNVDDWQDIKIEQERIGALKSKAINSLIQQCFSQFKDHYSLIMQGTFDNELTDIISSKQTLKDISDCNQKYLYPHRSVIKIELAGFEVLAHLTNYFLRAFKDKEDERSKRLLKLMPAQFNLNETNSSVSYHQTMMISDFISRMTDSYAVDLYKKIKGIELAII